MIKVIKHKGHRGLAGDAALILYSIKGVCITAEGLEGKQRTKQKFKNKIIFVKLWLYFFPTASLQFELKIFDVVA